MQSIKYVNNRKKTYAPYEHKLGLHLHLCIIYIYIYIKTGCWNLSMARNRMEWHIMHGVESVTVKQTVVSPPPTIQENNGPSLIPDK